MCIRFFVAGKPNVTRDLGESENARDPENIDLPDGAHGFQFFETPGLFEDPAHDPDARRSMYKSQRYLFGDVLNLDDVIDKLPDEPGLARRMRFNGWAHILRTPQGGFIPLETGDVVLDADKNVKFREEQGVTAHPDGTMNRILRKRKFRKLGGPS